LRRFCEFMGMTPDQLLTDRLRCLTSADEEVRFSHENRLEEFAREWARRPVWFDSQRRMAVTSVHTGVGYVSGFYAANRVSLGRVRLPKGRRVNVFHIPDQRELGLMVSALEDPMERAVVLGLAQSGISTEDFLELHLQESRSQRFGSLGRQLRSGAEILHVHIIRGKTEVEYDAFFGRAATSAFRALGHTEGYLVYPDRTAKPRSLQRRVERLVEAAARRAGIEGGTSPHCLRKFFNTSLKMTRLNDPAFNDLLVEYWMGHSLGRVRGAYFIPPVEKQMELYAQAEPRLEPQ